jgi:hypothetical protein
MSKVPLGVVYCRNQDCDFSACEDSSVIRAIGNFDTRFPDEELYLKNCKLVKHSLGECEHQAFFLTGYHLFLYFFTGVRIKNEFLGYYRHTSWSYHAH